MLIWDETLGFQNSALIPPVTARKVSLGTHPKCFHTNMIEERSFTSSLPHSLTMVTVDS